MPLDREVERLGLQAQIGWSQERERLISAGLRDDQRVIEIGSGPGVYAAQLLSAFPKTRYLAIDSDARLLQEDGHSGCAVSPVSPVSRLCCSASALSVGDATHDVAVARLLFQHLTDPAAAATEMARVLVPGGVAVIIDADDDPGTSFDPPIPALGPIAVKVRLAQLLQGGNRSIGHLLPRVLHRAGFRDVHFEAIAITSDDVGLEPFYRLHLTDFLRPLVDTSLVTVNEYEAARRGIETFFATPNATITERRCIAWGTKPRGA